MSSLVNISEHHDSSGISAFKLVGQFMGPSLAADLLDSIILPKLIYAINHWEALEDEPIGAWVLPWLAVIPPASASQVGVALQESLSSLLASWEINESPFLIPLIHPVISIMDSLQAERLLLSRVGPVLGRAISGAFVDSTSTTRMPPSMPSSTQEMGEAWSSLSAWSALFPTQVMVSFLESQFFPIWLRRLRAWLATSSPITNDEGGDGRAQMARLLLDWYVAWKRALPGGASVQGDSRVEAQLALGLKAMDGWIKNSSGGSGGSGGRPRRV